jgi:hypothetical protein
MPIARVAVALLVLLLASERVARAEDSKEVVEARAEFVKGADYIRELQYADALSAFEKSAKLRPHAATTYNIGACHRAMGRYALARKTLRAALAQDAAAGGTELPASLKSEVNAFLVQIDGLLAKVDVVLTPADAAIAVDGHPLEAAGAEMLAGTRPPGPGEPPPSPSFTMVLDPGPHVLTLSRKGFGEAVVNKSFAPGSATKLELVLDRLPATLAFSSSNAGAVVVVDTVDIGVAPVDVQRPAGKHHVTVKKPGFVTYEADLDAHPGERVDLRADLKEEKAALTQRWWFWTAAGVLVAGVAAGTYFATRPSPERPALNGGGLGWTLQAK